LGLGARAATRLEGRANPSSDEEDMAADLDLEKETVTHKRGYEGFVAMMKWGTILSAITALIVIFVISE
jgi:hypothetical protein